MTTRRNPEDEPGQNKPGSTEQSLDATLAPTVGPDAAQAEQSKDSRPHIVGYKLLDELGRGGMGVVYKARHEQLDRTVALKMILGGQLASDEDVHRFHLEAESAARLDHPSIVPIYEVGESNGHHFYAMKLIDGKPLSQLMADYQSDHRKLACLVIEIAKAIQHAHERGILHRDIKPANILIDNDGNPWITDMGLAKQLNDESGLTKTGLVMGSPGFMSPEQAAGKSDVTTGADIYALGAILFWLIAGRPPFTGDTQLEVILQTINQEPESVRAYRPETDRDLNLICQKALQKSPTDRYASAAALGADLQAWLDGEPLSVKPPSALKLTRLWVRKNFRTVAISLGAGLVCGFTIGFFVLIIMIDSQIDLARSSFAQLGSTEQSWLTTYFSWVKDIPRPILYMLPPSATWFAVFCGITTIGLVKPMSREVGFVAAFTSALVAGIVAFAISLGWSPITDHAIKNGSQDIRLISESMWVETTTERKLAQEALIRRYPGLESLDDNARGNLIFQKILIDQTYGVPKGLLIGIATTMFFAVFPILFSTALSGLIWDKGFRGWNYVGKSIELGIYSALLCLLMTKFVSNSIGSMPGIGLQLLTLGGLALALYWGIKDAKVVWRILGFALANICVFMNFSESSRIDGAANLAAGARTNSEFQNAAFYLNRRLEQSDNEFDRFNLAIIYLYLNESDEYAEQCTQMLANFENIYLPEAAERTAKVCLLKPELLSTDEVNTALELAEFASGFVSHEYREWLCFCRALSEMQKGDLASTLEWSARCRDAIATGKLKQRTRLIASTHLVDALAFQQERETERMNDSIESARNILANAEQAQDGSWQDRLIYEILLRKLGD